MVESVSFPPPFPAYLESPRLRMDGFARQDVADIVAAMQDAEIQHNLAYVPNPYTDLDAEGWLLQQRENHRTGEAWTLALRYKGYLAGSVELRPDFPAQAAEVGYWVGAAYRNRGLATEALQHLLYLSENRWRIRRHWAHVRAENHASRTVLEKLGFQWVHTAEQWFPHAREHRQVWYLERLHPDWQ
jgi:RimJ/RimL family protein N-acetyltransferase